MLSVVLVALALARQEAIVVVALIAIAGAMQTSSWRGLILWLVPVLPAIAWRVIAVRHDHALDLEALRGDGLPLAIAFALLWLMGVIRAWRHPLVVVTPILSLLFGLGAPAFPVFAIVVGCAASSTVRPRIAIAGGIVAALALAGLAVMPLRASIVQYAQDAADLDRRVEPFTARFADASVIAAHDPGAVAFYSGLPVIALDGDDPLEGPGARFERLERQPYRPSHFISSSTALGFDVLFGEVRGVGRAGPKLAKRTWTRGDLQWIEADWDHVQTGERPLTPHPGWHVVDRIDVADLADEAAHHWRAQTSGKQATLLHRDTAGILIDGGRTITGGEHFAIEIDPAKPARLILRTGGNRQYPDHEAVAAVSLQIGGTAVAIPAPRGVIEVEIEVPAGQREVAVTADHPYRAFHWFVLQRD